MVESRVIYQGDLRCEAVHGPSGVRIQTDAPADNHGKGGSFSPTDLLATSLAACILTTMGIVARRHDWDMAGATAHVEKHMSSEAPRRVARLVVRVAFPQDLPQEARMVLERTAHSCPVTLSLHSDVELNVSFQYGRI